MTVRVQLAEAAWDDIEALVDFLQKQGHPDAADLVRFILDGLKVLTHQPGVGRPMGQGLRELILHRGHSGYLVKYRYLPLLGSVRVLRLRPQRQSGYTSKEI